jgi:hypothetical protein
MSYQITLDLLTRIVNKSSVSYWRPKAWGETAPSQQFGTHRDWVEITGSTFSATLGSQHPASALLVRNTAFVPTGSPGGTVDEVVTLGNPNVIWQLSRRDQQPASPTFNSPIFDATSPPVDFRMQTTVDGVHHTLKLTLKIVTYNAGDPPPTDPIIIADLPEPDPQPVE